MAITRLTDIITVFDSKWTYGDVKFGYDGEVNQDHDTKYPLMLVTPPESIIPKIYDGREEYSFEINFYNLYSQSAQSVVTLQKRWDNLQDLSNEWLDMVLKNYQDVTVEAYLNDESIEIERIKDSKNDKLVRIKLLFTMSAFSVCFRPVSNYPSDFSDLVVWLRADSKATFSIPTGKVSYWADGSGNGNDVNQAIESKQPLRIGYDGANDKAFIKCTSSFKEDFKSLNNTPLSSGSFTIFTVAKQNIPESGKFSVFNYTKSNTTISIGFSSNRHSAKVSDGLPSANYSDGDSADYAIVAAAFSNTDGQLTTSVNGNTPNTSAALGWNSNTKFDSAQFSIGVLKPPIGADSYANANIEEVIVYNRRLEDNEISRVRDYLNTKYKIY